MRALRCAARGPQADSRRETLHGANLLKLRGPPTALYLEPEDEEWPVSGPRVKPPPAPAPAPRRKMPKPKFAVSEPVEALWKDGRYYKGAARRGISRSWPAGATWIVHEGVAAPPRVPRG